MGCAIDDFKRLCVDTEVLDQVQPKEAEQRGKRANGHDLQINTQEYLSSRTVNAITLITVAGIIENPELLSTYSWKRMLPTTALHLDFSPAERLAIGDWKDTKAMRDEVPITRRYAEVKEGKSRGCKLICAEVFAVLNKINTQAFKEIQRSNGNCWQRRPETKSGHSHSIL